MSANYLDVQSGKTVRKTAIESSTGSADAGKIPSTNAEGMLDLSLLTPETYTHNQLATSTVWNVNHNLRKYPSVTIFDSSGTQVEAVVNHVDNNNLIITLSYAISGTAQMN